MVYSLVVDSDMQGRCGDYCGSMGGIEQQTMVGSTGKGVGAHGFCCGPSGGGSAGMDGVVDAQYRSHSPSSRHTSTACYQRPLS